MKGESMSNKPGMRGHVGRGVLQESDRFTSEGKVVGEYVKNSWQYTDGPTTVSVLINQKNKSIQIKDTSRGMDKNTIENSFLVLHEENWDRKAGKISRGEYGTGKVAALGIAEILRVKTVKDNKSYIFEIHREDCAKEDSREEVKVRWIEDGVDTKNNNGTIIEILNFRQSRIISVKNIKNFLKSKTLVETVYEHPIELYVDHEKVEKINIPYSDLIIKKPNDEQKKLFGNCELIIKIATKNLSEDERGISIFAKGIYKAKINAAGEKSEFIFGECSCDKLIEETNPPIFDSSRREELNIDNEFAREFLSFVNYHVDITRKELIKKDSDRKKKERNEALQKEADKMKDFFNNDYKELELSYQKKIAKAKGNIDDKEDLTYKLGETKIVTGDDFLVKIVDGDEGSLTVEGGGGGGGEGNGGGDEKKSQTGKLEKTDEVTNHRGKDKSLSKKRSGGGFNFEYDNLGVDSKRAIYDDSQRLIKINLDHPLIAKTLSTTNNDQGSPIFIRASYEAAIFEYAIAVTQQQASSNLMEDTVSDAVFEIQEVVDRMLKKMSNLNVFNE